MKSFRMCLAAAAALTALVAAGTASATVLWQSDFVKKGLEQFDIYDVGPQVNPAYTPHSGPSKWHVDGGALHQDSNIYGDPDPTDTPDEDPYSGTSAVVKNFTAQDGIFYTQFRTTDDDGIGIVFRWQDEKNFMRLYSMRDPGNGGPLTRLEKWTDGNYTILAQTTDVVYQQNVRETMLVVANGGKIDAYLGDLNSPVLTTTDTAPAAGRFGIQLYAMSITNNVPLDITTLTALSADSSLFVTTLNGTDGNPLSGIWASLLDKSGNPVNGAFTNPAGQAVFLDATPGDYQISTGSLTQEPITPQAVTIKAGIGSATLKLNLTQNGQVATVTAFKLKLPATAADDFSSPTASETNFVDYTAPADWSDTDADNNIYGWLRAHVSVGAGAVGKDLVLNGFNFDDEDWTYWNGQLIGHTNNAAATRSYVIPGALVKADNVLAIRGYDGTGAGGITTGTPTLIFANSSVGFTGTVKDPSGKALSGIEVSASSTNTPWGPQNLSIVTDANGVYNLLGLAPGSYQITYTSRMDLDAVGPVTQTVTGTVGQPATANFTVTQRPSLSLATADGAKWLLASDTTAGDISLSGVIGVNESGLSPVNVAGRLEDQGAGDDLNYFWYRTHITLPADWKAAYQGRDLILTGFNVDDTDVTYFNGTKIGSSGTFPTDPADPTNTGYVSASGQIRTYTIPGNLVKWDGDNVLAINGYDGGGDGGITASAPELIVAPGTPTALKGDITGDGKVNIADATAALQFAVGNGTPTTAQIAAGDVVGGDGKITIPDVTKILQAAIGAIQL